MENCTQLLMNQVMHLYVQRSTQLFRNWDIQPGQAGLLWALSRNTGLSQKELAKKMGIKPPSITVMIKKMESEGLIEKQQDKSDQRIMRIFITDKGRKNAFYMDQVLNQLEKEVFANMNEQEIMLLRRLLLQMKENLLDGQKGEKGNHGKII